MSKRLISVEESEQKLQHRVFVLEQLQSKSPNQKLEKINQFEKDFKVINHERKQSTDS